MRNCLDTLRNAANSTVVNSSFAGIRATGLPSLIAPSSWLISFSAVGGHVDGRMFARVGRQRDGGCPGAVKRLHDAALSHPGHLPVQLRHLQRRPFADLIEARISSLPSLPFPAVHR